jgi:hypothetical protein
MAGLLEVSPPARDGLSRLRGRPEGLDSDELVVFELADLLRELQQWAGDSEIFVDERLVDQLQRIVNSAVGDLFTGKSSGEPFRPSWLPAKK